MVHSILQFAVLIGGNHTSIFHAVGHGDELIKRAALLIGIWQFILKSEVQGAQVTPTNTPTSTDNNERQQHRNSLFSRILDVNER